MDSTLSRDSQEEVDSEAESSTSNKTVFLEKVRQSNAACQSGDFLSAVKLYTEAISLDPSNHVLCSNRSAAYIKRGSMFMPFRMPLKQGNLIQNGQRWDLNIYLTGLHIAQELGDRSLEARAYAGLGSCSLLYGGLPAGKEVAREAAQDGSQHKGQSDRRQGMFHCCSGMGLHGSIQ